MVCSAEPQRKDLAAGAILEFIREEKAFLSIPKNRKAYVKACLKSYSNKWKRKLLPP